MKSEIDLLNDYKAEKGMVVGGLNERTGLEPFPTFKEWKATYIKEYNETHQTVSVEDADAMFDAAVKDAEDELAEMVSEFEDDSETETETEEGNEMTATATATKTAPATKTVTKTAATKATTRKATTATKPAAKKATTRKATTRKATTRKATTRKATTATKPAAKKAPSKASKALNIFNKFYGKKTRAEVIAKFVAQTGLTTNGAATYYQKFKKAAG